MPSPTLRLPLRFAAASALLALSACSSPFVGNWKGSGAAGDTVVRVKSDHTYTASATAKDGAIRASSGDWEKEGDKTMRLIQHTGDWPRVVNGELTAKKQLELVGEGVSATLKKD